VQGSDEDIGVLHDFYINKMISPAIPVKRVVGARVGRPRADRGARRIG